jgi:hypothetical protein
MKVEFSKRAVADLRKVSADSRVFGEAVVTAVERRIHQIISHIAARPDFAARVIERPGMHVIPLIRYPYKISIACSRIVCGYYISVTRRVGPGRGIDSPLTRSSP